jgi:signal transduction histidine kinase
VGVDGEEIVTKVNDTGIGIAEADQQRVFDEFFRSANAKEFQEAGTGLGLAIARSIAESMSGTISLESRLGEGSTFSFRIPIHRPDAPAQRVGA